MISTAKQYPETRLQDEDKGGPMPGRRRNREKMRGFTLIEVIVSLILVGILAAIGGMAIVQAVQGYMFVKDNATMTQKAQLAMSRITREIVEMTGITANATATILPVSNVDRNVTLGLHSGAIKIAPEGTELSDGDTLVDNVNAFSLTYYSKDSSGNDVIATSWSTAKEISLLAAIDVNLQLARPSGGYMNFANRVSPRNNKNQGGAPPNVPPPTIPHYGCFVATAAFGDAGHPMVMLLRDFRDRYLLTWQGGRWLVKQYYIYGPAAADLIRNRPLAMWAIRCLLAPIAALTFFLLYAPLAIPFILLTAVIFIGALFSAGRRGKITFPSVRFNQRGSILIALIGTMVIMAALGAAMLPMFSSSSMNQVYSDHGRKAYFLAESGFRYAASEFLNAGTQAAKQTVLTNINNKTCNLLSSGGSFTLVVYPFWTVSQTQSGTTLTTQIGGSVPAQLNTGTGGYLRVGTSSSYHSYTSRTGSGTTVTFSGLSGTVSAAQDILPVALPSGTGTTTVTEGGNLTLNGTGADAFPPVNGNFTLYPTPAGLTGGLVFNYEKKVGNTLQNITLADPTKTWPATNVTVTGGAITNTNTTKITLDKFLRLSSTGHYGQATRPILYNVPVGWMVGGGEFAKKQFHDQFTSDANWYTDHDLGGHSVSGGAMNVTQVVDPTTTGSDLLNWLFGLFGWGNDGLWAVNAWKWLATETNLAQAWHDAGGNLGYDLQLKMKSTQPYWMGGLGFRMRGNSNNTDVYTYGLSFIRQRQTRYTLTNLLNWGYEDGINPSLRPPTVAWTASHSIGWPSQARYSEPAIVLWQRTGPATGTGSFKILAHLPMTAASDLGLTTGTGVDMRLKDWSTLMVRLVEGYELPFSQGRVDASGRHLKYGDFIRNIDGSKTARVIGTPVMSTAWGVNNTTTGVGRLMLTNVTGSGFSSENIYLDGGIAGTAYAYADLQETTKANYIMVYTSGNASGAGNTSQADNTRIGNLRDSANWPPDDWTDRAAANDYFTLVKWIGSANVTYQFNARSNNGSYDEGSSLGSSRIVDGNDTTQGRDNDEGHYVTLTGNTCLGTNLGTITRVTIAYRGSSDYDATNIYQRFVPYFGGSSAGANYDSTDNSAEGSPGWSEEFDITNDPSAPSTWSWSDVQNLDLRWITKRPNTGRLNTYAVRITVTYHTIPTLDTTADAQGNVAEYVPALAGSDFQWAVIKTSAPSNVPFPRAMRSPPWTSSSTAADFSPGDHIALLTSSSAGTSISYDDFAIQLDLKSGTGFLPPIQQ